MTPPSASRSPDLQQATVTPGVPRSQIASSNRTANAFLGRRPSWLTAQKSSANPAPVKDPTAPKTASVLPSLPEASPPPAPEQLPSCQAEPSQRSDSSLLSPAPTDEASPNNHDKGDSPVFSNRLLPLPGLQPNHANGADLNTNTATTHQGRAQNGNGNGVSNGNGDEIAADGQGLGITAAGDSTQLDGTASSEVVPAHEGQAMEPVAPPTLLPPWSPSSSTTTAPEAGAATSALPPTSYAVTGLARFALIDSSPKETPKETPKEIDAAPRLEDLNMQAAPITLASSSTSTPIAAQTPVLSSTPSSTPALIASPAPAPVQPSVPTAVIDLESSPDSTTSSHMSASLCSATSATSTTTTAEHNPYFPRLVASTTRPSPLFKYVDYIGFVNEQVSLMTKEARLSADTEVPRLSLVVEACRLEDGFFILVHQLYCLWSVDHSTCYKHLKPMKPDAIDMGFRVIESIFKRNDLLRPTLQVWLASFPRSFQSMMADPSPYASVLPGVVTFLTSLPRHWDALRMKVTQRGYPVLMDELVSQLFCLSPILQTILFTSMRRHLSVVDGEFGTKFKRLFYADQRAHTPKAGMFIGLPCELFSDLEQMNARLIAAYRQTIAQCRASLSSMEQAANQAPASVQARNAQNQAGQGQPQAQPQASWQPQQSQHQQSHYQQSLEAALFQQLQQSQATQNVTRPTSHHRSHSTTSGEIAAHAYRVLQGQHAQHAQHVQQGYQQTMHPAPGPAASPISLSAFAEQMAQQQIMPNQQQAMQAIPRQVTQVTQVRPAVGQENAGSLQTAEAAHVAQMQQMREMQQKVQQQLLQLDRTPQTPGSSQQIIQMQSAYHQQLASLQHQMQRIEQTCKSRLQQLQLAQTGQGQPATPLNAHAHMVPTQQPQSQPNYYQHHLQQQSLEQHQHQHQQRQHQHQHQHQQQWAPQQQSNYQQAQQSWLQQQQQQQQQLQQQLQQQQKQQQQQQMRQQMQIILQQGQQRPIRSSQALSQNGQQPQTMPSGAHAMQSAGGIHAIVNINTVQSSLRSPVPSPIQSPSLHQRNRLPDAHRRPSASATFATDSMPGTQKPAQSSAEPLPRGAQQPLQPQQQHPVAQVVPQAQRQRDRANPALRTNHQGAPVERQAAAKAKPSTVRSMFPPKGTVITLAERPHDPSDKRAIAMSLAQARCRSPSRVVVDADFKQPVRAEPAGTRFYQFVQRLVLGPVLAPARLYTYHLEFFVTEEEYALRAVEVIPEGELLPVEKHVDGSLQYRLRCCKGRAEGVAATESDWVTMNTSWPTNIFMNLNGHAVSVRRKSHFSRDMPTNITQLVRVGVNHLQVVISAPPQQPANAKQYLLGVDVVETASYARVKSQIDKHSAQDVSVTVNEIIGRLQRSASDDDDFALLREDLSIDLADPFSARIFNTPVRGAQCQHFECFDLDNWLETRPFKPPPTCQHLADCRCPKTPEPTLPDKWRCPICSRDARPTSLRIDQFLVNVRRTLEETGKLGRVKSILVAKDGTWKPVVEDEDDDDDDNDNNGNNDDNDGMGQASGQASGRGQPGLSGKDKGKRRAADSPPRGEPAPKAARVASGSGPRSAPVASSRRLSQAIEVIELDSD